MNMNPKASITLWGEERTGEINIVAPHLAFFSESLAFQVGRAGVKVYHRPLRLWPRAGVASDQTWQRGVNMGIVIADENGDEYMLELHDSFHRGRSSQARAIGWADQVEATAL